MYVSQFMHYQHTFLPMDNHVDQKFEDAIAAGARIYFNKLTGLNVDAKVESTIRHTDWRRKDFLSRQHPHITRKHLKR